MTFFSLLSKEDISIAPETKIIKKQDFSTLLSANKILTKVKKSALEYKKEVTKECEAIKELAYKQGFTEGLEKLNEQALFLDKKIKSLEKDVEQKILTVALKAAKKILGEELKLNPDRIVDIVKQAIKPVIEHDKIKIYVNKKDLEILEKNKGEIQQMLKNAKGISIQIRDDIEEGGCIIETKAGIINAQLENQWKALEIAFEKFMKLL